MSQELMLRTLLKMVVQDGASDLHLSPGAPPRFRLRGQLVDVSDKLLTVEIIKEAIKPLLLSADGQVELAEHGDYDFSVTIDEQRFRGHAAKTQNGVAYALRHLPNKIPGIAKLGLPEQTIISLLNRKDGGIILVTGPTGSGKSTTLASMVAWLNHNHHSHIITIEAPVEYLHPHGTCNVDQRELPLDSPNFASAVRAALRQDPDIILVGEMRDLETISAAMTAAETGHLVLSTLHTNSAAETINRIIDVFPRDQQEQIRTQLAQSLLAVISQRLLPTKDGQGRVAAFELMIRTAAIAANIRDNKVVQILSTIETGHREGMVAFDSYLARLCDTGRISEELALQYAHSPKDFKGRLHQSSFPRSK